MPTTAVCDDAVVAGLLLDALVVDGEQGGTSQIFQRNETEWDTVRFAAFVVGRLNIDVAKAVGVPLIPRVVLR